MSKTTLAQLNTYITPTQFKLLKDYSRETGSPVAALVRKALDLWLRTESFKRAPTPTADHFTIHQGDDDEGR